MLQAFFKRNGILLVIFFVYLGAVLGTCGLIDVAIYQTRKRDVIFDYARHIFPKEVQDSLDRLARDWREALGNGLKEGPELQALRERSRAIVEGPTSIYRIEVRGAGGNSAFDERADKFLRFNNFSNSLWLPSFSRRVGQEFYQVSSGENLGWYTYYFTTPDTLPPEGLAEIRDLTTRFRAITLGIAAVMTALTAFFTFRVLIPMRNVIDSIESSRDGRNPLVLRPGSRLEILYNRMALEALLSRLQEYLGERIQRESGLTGWELLEAACDYFVEGRPGMSMACLELRDEGPGRPHATGRVSLYQSSATRSRNGDLTKESILASFDGEKRESSFQARHTLPDASRPGMRYGLALRIAGGRNENKATAEDLLRRFGLILDRAFEALHARNAALEHERGRASINLSRNLGHDLTNIIATSKLDLMTLESIIGPGAQPLDEIRKSVMQESLRGLLDSTRFLQEVVNLYRAYAFLRHPVLEVQDANALIAETVELFKLSTSERVRFEELLDPAAPRCRVDPRLLKLALFNLFSNAVDAIRRGGATDETGVIRVSTERASTGGLLITVRDSGEGIRTAGGGLMDPAEIEKIFALGYTQGRGEEGEGLGLNWVRTIVRDLHAGTIEAGNSPDGGAFFALGFPPVEAT